MTEQIKVSLRRAVQCMAETVQVEKEIGVNRGSQGSKTVKMVTYWTEWAALAAFLHLSSIAFMFLAVYDSSEEITQVLDHEARCCLATSGLPMTFPLEQIAVGQQLSNVSKLCWSKKVKKEKKRCPAVANHAEMQHAAELASQQSR